MTCQVCAAAVRQTLSDRVGRLGLYQTVAYYCDHCDKIFVVEKYKDTIDKHKYDGELDWLRAQNPNR